MNEVRPCLLGKVNAVDVTVLLHDCKQPLCVDGMVWHSARVMQSLVGDCRVIAQVR